MSDSGKAVFLSYASQDAEAAKRICDALRQAGVEVWFDQSELVGGDAWDQKIRKQIRECALLIPVVSQATQGRREAYFRLEWKLADERTHLMAKGTPFILPVTIDETNDRDALVPDGFLAVQWTRAPRGEVPAAFVARVGKILSGEQASHGLGRATGPGSAAADNGKAESREHVAGVGDPGRSPASARPATIKPSRPRWLVPVLAAVAVAIGGVWFALRPRPAPASSLPPPASGAALAAPAATSPARELAAKARAIAADPDVTRDELMLAEDYCRQALKLEENDGEIWASYSEVSSMYFGSGIDRSPERRELARSHVERAMQLAPRSTEARYAKASYLRRLGGPAPAEAEKILRELATEIPEDHRVWISLGKVVWGALGQFDLTRADEALALFDRAAQIPAGRAEALGERGWLLVNLARFEEADAALKASLAVKQLKGKWGAWAYLALLRGELEAVQAAVEKMSVGQTDQGAEFKAEIWLRLRQPEKALEVLALLPRDYLTNVVQANTTDGLRAYAYDMQRKTVAARNARESALKVVDQRLASSPRDRFLLVERAELLAQLDRREDAVAALRLFEEIAAAEPFGGLTRYTPVAAHALLEPPDQVVDYIEARCQRMPTGHLRTSYRLDRLRGNARYEGLLKLTYVGEVPGAKLPAIGGQPSASELKPNTSTPAPDSKSIAVLPFANLSGDPAQEYFSDGLTEEILNALANERDLRVPGRASAFAVKGKGLSVPEIARALNVAQLVEGSVRKAGNQVKIIVSLTRASDGFSEPLGTFTEKLDDIFALQEKVACAVVEKVTKRTTTATGVAVQTKNPAAYDAYLRARARQVSQAAAVDGAETIRLYEEAIRLDPQYALAYARLSQVYERAFSAGFDRSQAMRVKAKEAASAARRLAPDLPEGHQAMAMVHVTFDYDHDAAAKELAEAERLRPNDPEAPWVQSRFAFARGAWDGTLARLILRAAELDPQNAANLISMASMLHNVGRYADAERLITQSLAVVPNASAVTRRFANYLEWTGDLRRAREIIEAFPETGVGGYMPFWNTRAVARTLQGDLAGARSDHEKVRTEMASGKYPLSSGGRGQVIEATRALGRLEARQGHAARAAELLREALSEAQRLMADFPEEPNSQLRLAVLQAETGQRAEALVAAADGLRRAKQTRHYIVLAAALRNRAEVFALLGDIDAAVADLRTVHEMGYSFGYRLRLDPEWEPLRQDPKFQQLMKETEAKADAQPRPGPGPR